MCDRLCIGKRLRKRYCRRCGGDGETTEIVMGYDQFEGYELRTCPRCGGSGVEPPHTAEELSDAND